MRVNEIAAAIHKRMCEDSRFGYSWGERWGAIPETWTIDGKRYTIKVGDYDCSSSVLTAWRLALSHTPYAGALDAATYTGNMVNVFLSSGLFAWEGMDFLAEPGDLYLNEVDHVAMCQTQEPDILSEFSINENGEVYGGKRGDQTGWESSVHSYYDFPWDGILHYNGKADADGAQGDIRYRVSIDPNGVEWLPEMVGLHDTGGSGDDFAGEPGEPIRWIAVDGARYRACTEDAGWLPAVDRYDIGDLDYGCAGDGSPITDFEVLDDGVNCEVHRMVDTVRIWKR